MKRIFPCLVLLALFSRGPMYAEEAASSSKSRWREYFGLDKSEAPEKTRTRASEQTGGSNPEGMLDLIDSPTSNVLDYGGYRLNFRLYSNGGVQGHISFGVFRRLNMGAAWDIEHLMGSEDPRTVAPTLNVKFRVYDGGVILPSVAVGYDGQGRFYDRTLDEYTERERGLYTVLSREIILPNLSIHGGANIAKFKEGEVHGFAGISYMIEEKVAVFTEYDNLRVARENRWNAGVRFFPTSSLGIDFAVRRLGSVYDKERIIRINYVGTF